MRLERCIARHVCVHHAPASPGSICHDGFFSGIEGGEGGAFFWERFSPFSHLSKKKKAKCKDATLTSHAEAEDFDDSW